MAKKSAIGWVDNYGNKWQVADVMITTVGAATIANKKAEENFPSDSSCSALLYTPSKRVKRAIMTSDEQEDVSATLLLPEIWIDIFSHLSQVHSCL